MMKYTKVVFNHKDAMPKYSNSFITVGDCSELIEELIKNYESGDIANDLAKEYLDDSGIDLSEVKTEYPLVDDFVIDVLGYFGYLFDIEDEQHYDI